jgi:hypothetical protein
MRALCGFVLCCLLLVVCNFCVWLPQPHFAYGDEAHKAHQKEKKKRTVAGKADVLRHVPKKFAKLLEVDVGRRQVRLQMEGEESPKTWPVNDDAELKIAGWWGRLEQFNQGDRVWVWFDIDRKRQPVSILMLADEISERDIHSAAKPEEIEPLRSKQREHLRSIWRSEGLPGTVVVLHKLGGEMDVLLDHEAIRWGRYLKNGNQVTLQSDAPIKAAVKDVRPWRERTLIRLVTNSGVDQGDLSLGQRIGLLVPEPPAEVQSSNLPTDVGRARTDDERIDWFLASIYCTCKIGGDRCTGMFYVQSSCNENGCHMPNKMRGIVSGLIDDGKSDREVFDHLLKTRGPELLKPHLLK